MGGKGSEAGSHPELFSAVQFRMADILCSVVGDRTRGVKTRAGINSAKPARAFMDIAHRELTLSASKPISNPPSGVPTPMQKLIKPIMRPRSSSGAESMVMELCMVPKPDCPYAPNSQQSKGQAVPGRPGPQDGDDQHQDRTDNKHPAVVPQVPAAGHQGGADQLSHSLRRYQHAIQGFTDTKDMFTPMSGSNCCAGKASAFMIIVT